MCTLLLDLAGERIGDDEVGLVALDVPGTWRPSSRLPCWTGSGSSVDLVAGRHRRDVEELGPLAVGRRPEIVAAAHATGTASWCGRSSVWFCMPGIDLDVLAGIVVDRLAGLLVDALGPVDRVQIGLGQHGLPVVALERVEEAVARRMGDQLARLAVDLRRRSGCGCRPRHNPTCRRAGTGRYQFILPVSGFHEIMLSV